jgi:transcription elongation factor Elf1
MLSRTSRLLRALRRRGRPPRLVDCPICGRDFVVPVAWSDLDERRWAIRLRCGECGTAREVVVDDAEARRYEADLDTGTRAIAWGLSRMKRDGLRSPAG